jgi:hypothetical protein
MEASLRQIKPPRPNAALAEWRVAIQNIWSSSRNIDVRTRSRVARRHDAHVVYSLFDGVRQSRQHGDSVEDIREETERALVAKALRCGLAVPISALGHRQPSELLAAGKSATSYTMPMSDTSALV